MRLPAVDLGKRSNEQIGVLDWNQPGHVAAHDGVVGKAGLVTQSRAAVGRARQGVQIQPQRHHDDLACRSNPEDLDEIGALGRRNRDDAVAHTRKRALDDAHRPIRHRTEVALHDVSVERVHHDGAPARASRRVVQQRGNAAERPALAVWVWTMSGFRRRRSP